MYKINDQAGSKSQSAVMKKAQMAIEEARMVVPGLQALFGFQLIAIFNRRFELRLST